MVYRSEERDLCSCGVMREIKSCVGAQFEYVLCGGFFVLLRWYMDWVAGKVVSVLFWKVSNHTAKHAQPPTAEPAR